MRSQYMTRQFIQHCIQLLRNDGLQHDRFDRVLEGRLAETSHHRPLLHPIRSQAGILSEQLLAIRINTLIHLTGFSQVGILIATLRASITSL